MPVTGHALFARAHPILFSELGELRREWQAALRRLQVRPRKRQHHDVRRLLRAKHLHRYFAFEALRRLNRLGSASRETIDTLAEEFDPFRPVKDERVVIRQISSGPRSRRVQDFGPIRRMHQIAIDGLLRSLHPLREEQKLFNGGMPVALAAIEGAISRGMTHGCEVDLINFYGSVSFDGLPKLMRPLPSSVTQHVVWDVSLREQPDLLVCPQSSRPIPTPEMPNGLSLGSATSPIVGEVIIAQLLAAAQLTDVVTYADNLFVYGRSEGEVLARIQSLRDGIASAEFGISGLSFDTRTICKLKDGFEFANHRGRPLDDGFEWAPGDRRLGDFQISAAERVSVAQLERSMRQVANWRRYYSSWAMGDLYEAEYLASLKVRRYLLDRSPLNCAEAASAVVDAFLAWERSRPIQDFLADYEALPGSAESGYPVGPLMERIRRRIMEIERPMPLEPTF